MPFIADLEAPDESRGPIWGPFAIIRDNVERLVALNLAWSAQLVPGLLALPLPQLPLWLRVVMGFYSATIAIPATGALYALTLATMRGELLTVDLARDLWREVAVPSFRVLTPLYGLFGLLIWLALLAAPTFPAVTTLATLAGLLWYLCATYWGPMLAMHPHASMRAIATDAVAFVVRFPLETLATSLVTAAALLIGFISIGGLFLIVPVAVALLQTQRFLNVSNHADHFVRTPSDSFASSTALYPAAPPLLSHWERLPPLVEGGSGGSRGAPPVEGGSGGSRSGGEGQRE